MNVCLYVCFYTLYLNTYERERERDCVSQLYFETVFVLEEIRTVCKIHTHKNFVGIIRIKKNCWIEGSKTTTLRGEIYADDGRQEGNLDKYWACELVANPGQKHYCTI